MLLSGFKKLGVMVLLGWSISAVAADQPQSIANKEQTRELQMTQASGENISSLAVAMVGGGMILLGLGMSPRRLSQKSSVEQ